ncbi:helix-turn-helix transcriptional regulator [Streptomonospora sp. S1-112]|uniref:Helix-turn-helix transcriptional regulator n=1 Tax=Streptomonospora mangrovi TaxID=2883123 RepID=A0A9X3SEG5_9ACTN|nr:helix-turn-helix transcriptional regulator [Streptomonospora mangrovi]MDA0565858.1 helix-turn-helix transcriptional regulator [Streptomonospora mangrovi]
MAEQVNEQWARWGAELRRLRKMAGKNQTDAARMIHQSRQLIGKMENGTRTPNRDQAGALDEGLATGGVLLQRWRELSGTHDVPDEWNDFILMERAAIEIREYQPLIVPGLLQSPKYARTILWRRALAEEQVDQLIASRMARLEQLNPRTELRFVLDEYALTRTMVMPEVMAEQLDHLVTVVNRHGIVLSVVPHDIRRPRVGVCGSFRIATMADGRQIVHAEHIKGMVLIEKATEVADVSNQFGDLQVEALSPDQSLILIKRMRSDIP